MIKCTCGCDPEVCVCAYQDYFEPPPDDGWHDYDDDEEEGDFSDDAPEYDGTPADDD